MSLSKSSLALQWAIEDLLSRATSPCGFYTVTCAEFGGLEWKEFSVRHAYMIRSMSRDVSRRKLKPFGGVRVFEEGEKTFRAHSHIVMTPRIHQNTLQHYATLASLGMVWHDYRPAGVYLGHYLAKYLSGGGSLGGVRRWSCFGDFSSHKVRDIEVTSPEIELFKRCFTEAKAQGMSKTQAFTEAARRVNCEKYGFFPAREQTAPRLAAVSAGASEKTETTAVWNVLDNAGQPVILKHDETFPSARG